MMKAGLIIVVIIKIEYYLFVETLHLKILILNWIRKFPKMSIFLIFGEIQIFAQESTKIAGGWRVEARAEECEAVGGTRPQPVH